MGLKGLEFGDAQAMAQVNPEAFCAPSLKRVAKVVAGEQIQVSLFGERLWLTVLGVARHREAPEYLGELSEDPAFARCSDLALHKGKTFWVEPRHIFAIRPAICVNHTTKH